MKKIVGHLALTADGEDGPTVDTACGKKVKRRKSPPLPWLFCSRCVESMVQRENELRRRMREKANGISFYVEEIREELTKP